MEFIFHTVIEQEGQRSYYNIHRIDEQHFFAECHHFNRERACEGDFELHKENEEWKAADAKFDSRAQVIGEEIERMYQDNGRD